MRNMESIINEIKGSALVIIGLTIAIDCGMFAARSLIFPADIYDAGSCDSLQGRYVSSENIISGSGDETRVIDLEIVGINGGYKASNCDKLQVKSFELSDGLDLPEKDGEIVASLSDGVINSWRSATRGERDAAREQRESREFCQRFTLICAVIFPLLILFSCCFM